MITFTTNVFLLVGGFIALFSMSVNADEITKCKSSVDKALLRVSFVAGGIGAIMGLGGGWHLCMLTSMRASLQ